MVYKGMSAIMCMDMDIEKLVESYAYTLVGKFSFHHPLLDDIQPFFHNLKFFDVFSIELFDACHILIKLSNDIDYRKGFCGVHIMFITI